MKYTFKSITNSLIVLPMLMASQSAIASAPLCSEVLKTISPMISQDVLDSTITDLARLKIEADLVLIAGSTISPAQGFSKTLFERKFSEAAAHLKGSKSETDLKKLIIEKIAVLRGDKDADAKREARRRAAQEKKLAAGKYRKPYKRAQTIDLSGFFRRHSLTRNVFAFVKKKNWLLVSTENRTEGHKTHIIDLANKNALSNFIDPSYGKILNSTFVANRLVAHRIKKPSGEEVLQIYDIESTKTKKVALDADVVQGRDEREMKLSPSGEAMLIKSWDNNLKTSFLYLMNLRTGVKQNIELPKELMFNDFIFVNENQIVFEQLRTWVYDINLYDISSGNIEKLHTAKAMTDLHYDSQTQTLYIKEPQEGHSVYDIYVKRLGIATIELPAELSLTPRSIQNIALLPEAGLLVSDYNNNAALITSYNGALTEQGHSLKYKNNSPPNYFDAYGATASSDTKMIFQLFRPHWADMNAPYIDIWTEKPAPKKK